MAVTSHDRNIDAVGACVGQRGTRVQSVITELNGEKIDIIQWNPDIKEFISSALSPARVISVILNEEEQSARVIVADHQLSLAIGKEGQNARLAAKLTDWRIDIRSEAQYREMLEESWMSDFDEAIAADEVERGTWEDDDEEAWDDDQEVPGPQVSDEQVAADYLDQLKRTIDRADEESPTDNAGA